MSNITAIQRVYDATLASGERAAFKALNRTIWMAYCRMAYTTHHYIVDDDKALLRDLYLKGDKVIAGWGDDWKISRFEDGRVQVHTTLQANGWVCSHNQLPTRAVYERGDEVIELEDGGVAFYSLGDRRVTNGTWETIVERFAVKGA